MFLPLHAAGIYTGPDQVCASDFVVSSYTPSLSALIKARRYFVPIKLESISALLVSERGGLGYAPLLKAEEEVCSISMLMKNASIKHELTTAPMKHKVIEFLPSVNLLHLSCHGIQRERALESHFILHDGTLTIAELTKLELPNAVFAFLSACETAKGDQSQPDQAIHLAASLLFCGFRTVIGTMW
jgi:CHAT domain-containing protein